MKNSERFENYMTTMANKLNSGESFKSSSKFTADLTFIRMPKGGKSGRQKALVGKRSMAEVLKKKHSVIQITNSDELCCARAICIAKAWIHKDEGYRQKIDCENVKRCETVQSRMAHQLHEDAGGPLGGMRARRIEKISKLPSTRLPIESDGNFLPLHDDICRPKSTPILSASCSRNTMTLRLVTMTLAHLTLVF